jgi:hypothetical protein
MNCAAAEILICDYAEGALGPEERTELERHLVECATCAELARDSMAAIRFMERAADVEPPPELISRILFDPPWRKRREGWFSRSFHAILQPRFAMGMALTVLSLAMIMPRVGQFQPSDLSPRAVWGGIEDRVYRFWARTEKFYDNLKFVYQIQATLREWQQQTQEPTGSQTAPPKNRTEQRRIPVEPVPEPAPGKP